MIRWIRWQWYFLRLKRRAFRYWRMGYAFSPLARCRECWTLHPYHHRGCTSRIPRE